MNANRNEVNGSRWATLKNMGFEFKKAPRKANSAGFMMGHQDWNFELTVYIDYDVSMSHSEVYEKWLQNAEEYTCLLGTPDWVKAAPKIMELAKVEEKLGRLTSKLCFNQEDLL